LNSTHQFTNSPIHQVIVVGAGISGLAAAYYLHQRGLAPIVLEASSRSGGLIRTEHVDGFTIEAGPDSVLAAKPAATELMRELGLDAKIQDIRPPGGAFVLRGSKLYRLPRPSLLGIPLSWRALLSYDLLPWHARVRLALEPTGRKRRIRAVAGSDPNGDESVAAFFRRRFGPDTVDLIAQPLLGGIHAGDIEQLSMASLFPRLLELERSYGSVLGRSAFAPSALRRDKGSNETPFKSLRGGMGALVAALEAALPPGTVRYNARVARIEKTADGWRARVADLPAEAGSHNSARDDCGFRLQVEGTAIVLACPAGVAAELLEPIDANAAALCSRVPYVSTASVALAWPRRAIPHPLDGTGFVVARRQSSVRITACTWVSSKWDDRAPDGMALLRAFIGGAHDTAAASLSDAELAGIVRNDLARVLGVRAEPALTRVYRWINAGAQHTVGHLDRVAAIEQRLASIGGVFVIGSGFRSVGIPDCVADAKRIAAQAADCTRL
jgi:protoporphyrinogen/coproporphyrinogen III oxidase